MFAQTDTYTIADPLTLKINIPQVSAEVSVGSGYKFLWMKSDFSQSTSKSNSDYSMLTLDPDLPAVTSYPDSNYGIMLYAATTDAVEWQLQESPTSILSTTSAFNVVATTAASRGSAFIPQTSPVSWSGGGTGIGSGLSLVDNSWVYEASTSSGVYNNKIADPWAVININLESGYELYQLRYDFSSDATNYRKKIKYIDVYSWNGSAWVLAQTFSTLSPVVGATTSEYFILSNPINLDTTSKQIKIQCRANWADPNGHYWVSEIVPYVRQL